MPKKERKGHITSYETNDPRYRNPMRNISLYLPIKWIEQINDLTLKEIFPNFSEYIRFAIRRELDERKYDTKLKPLREPSKDILTHLT